MADQVHQTDNDRDVQEAIRISKGIQSIESVKKKTTMSHEEQLAERRAKLKSSMSRDDQLAERRANLKKRKAEEELQPVGSAKHLNSAPLRPVIERASSSASSSHSRPKSESIPINCWSTN